MSKKLERKPITNPKPVPPICLFKAGMPCFEITKLKKELDVQMDRAETWKREHHTMLSKASLLSHKISALREVQDMSKAALIDAKAEMHYYRRAFKKMLIINIIFTIGFAVMTAILIWR